MPDKKHAVVLSLVVCVFAGESSVGKEQREAEAFAGGDQDKQEEGEESQDTGQEGVSVVQEDAAGASVGVHGRLSAPFLLVKYI